MTCEKHNYVRSNGLCIECDGGGSMLMAMYPVLVVSFITFLSVVTCMWITEKDEEADLAEDEKEKEGDTKTPAKHTETALDNAKSAHHHDHMSRRAASTSRSIKGAKRAKGMATKQQVFQDITNQYVFFFNFACFACFSLTFLTFFNWGPGYLQIKNNNRLGPNRGVVVRHFSKHPLAKHVSELYIEI